MLKSCSSANTPQRTQLGRISRSLPRYLIRISTGLEPAEELIARIDKALNLATK
ncbi:hypothetical protein P4C99_12185 [Pontiellaceae bacterium B1224]|nr:hypothetical protein [Pontiellaceae bacterium B1224]